MRFLLALLSCALAAFPVAQPCAPGQHNRTCITHENIGANGFRSRCICPSAGPHRHFLLVIDNILWLNPVLAPEGATKTYVAANSTVPGPPIVVDEGDWVVVRVFNHLDVETTLHWHGILQVLTPFSDGVPAMTQCAIAPHKMMTYSFRATSAGTYWYHGLMMEQKVDGLVGALIIRAPPRARAAPPAHDDEVTLIITDFYTDDGVALASTFFLTPDSGGAVPVPDAISVNAKFSTAIAGAPHLFIPVRSRKSKTLVRVIAANALSVFRVSVDGVNLRVVEVDATPVKPLVVDSVTLNVAQRAAFLIDWSELRNDAPAGSLFLRVTAKEDVYPYNISDFEALPEYKRAPGRGLLDPNFLGVFQFGQPPGKRVMPLYAPNATRPAAPPITQSRDYAGVGGIEPDANLVDAQPVIAYRIPEPTRQLYLEISSSPDVMNVNRARFNGISHAHDVRTPTPALYRYINAPVALGIAETRGALPFAAAEPPDTGAGAPPPAEPIWYNKDAHYVLPAGAAVVAFINNTDDRAHSIHVHGHVFWLVATSERPERERVAARHPLRRDVVSVPARGWAKIAFVADNPGVWALQGQSDWHAAAGLMIELFEAVDTLRTLTAPAVLRAACTK